MRCMQAAAPRSVGHRLTAITAFALYAAAVTYVPLAHAVDEVWHSRIAIEAHHMADCPILAGGPLCSLLATVRGTADPAPRFILPTRAALVAVERPQPTSVQNRTHSRRPSVRDPPEI
jgi:hypothetical protein